MTKKGRDEKPVKAERKDAFKPPEFDRDVFVKKEMRDSHAAFAAMGFAIVMGVLSYLMHRYLGSAPAGIALGLFGTVGIRFLYGSLKVKIEEFTWKNWLGNGAVYVITWLSVWIILINPPVGDLTAPTLRLAADTVQEIGPDGTLPDRIEITVYDNRKVVAVEITFTEANPDPGYLNATMPGMDATVPMERTGDDTWVHIHDDGFPPGTYSYRVSARDDSGNERTRSFKLTVVEAEAPRFVLILPEVTDGSVLDANNIEIRVSDNVRVTDLRYRVDNGTWQPLKHSRVSGEERQRQSRISVRNWKQGEYLVEIMAEDAAGNTAERTLNFTIVG